jgi:hypothetical protein
MREKLKHFTQQFEIREQQFQHQVKPYFLLEDFMSIQQLEPCERKAVFENKQEDVLKIPTNIWNCVCNS